MTILIINGNQDIVKEIFPKMTFDYNTTNTVTFNVGPKRFLKLRDYIRSKGINPYAFMSW